MKKPIIIEQMIPYRDLLDEIPCHHKNIMPEKEYGGINIHEQIGIHEVTQIDKVAGMVTLTMTPVVRETEDAEMIVKLLTQKQK